MAGEYFVTGLTYQTFQTTTTNGTALSDATWQLWNVTGTTTSSTIIWNNWNYDILANRTFLTPYQHHFDPVPEPTPEERAARLAEQQRREVEYQARLQKDREEKAAADAKAAELLLSLLSPEQTAQFQKERRFLVISADGERTYRVREGWSGNVDLLRNGRKVRTYCLHPRENVPVLDNLVAQKLLLEADEERFLRLANVS